MLSDSQLKLVAETLSNVGLVFFASLVVPVFIDINIGFGVVIVGILLSFISWLASLLLVKNLSL